MRPQVIKLSPDGKILVTSGKTNELIVLNPSNGKIIQRVIFPSASVDSNAPDSVSSRILELDKKAQVSYTGLVFSPDSKWIYLSNVNGDIKVFSVGADHRVQASSSIPLPPTDIRLKNDRRDIPAGLAISDDGVRLYIVLNISNQLLELDLTTKRAFRYFDVGVCPYTVCLVAGKAYVSNWGGPRPEDSSVTGPIGVTGRVRVDPVRFIADQGSVSVIDLAAGKTKTEIRAGLHASALERTKNGQYLFVANSAGDTLSIIDTSADKIVETVDMNWRTGDLFGASPDGIAFDNEIGRAHV
jgi:DNA-binding beta-propeller fold protein YncE